MWKSLKGIVVAGGWVLLGGGVVVLCTMLLLAFALRGTSRSDPSPPPNAQTGTEASEEQTADTGSPAADAATEDAVDLTRPLHEDLTLVESAIADIGAALANDPDNESLKGLLVTAYRNHMMLLKKSLHLVADDAEEIEGD